MIILCVCSWLFLQPLSGTSENPNVCHEITKKVIHSKAKLHHPCLFCSFHHHVLFFPELPRLWQVVWACVVAYLLAISFKHLFALLVRYSRPLSHAPPNNAFVLWV